MVVASQHTGPGPAAPAEWRQPPQRPPFKPCMPFSGTRLPDTVHRMCMRSPVVHCSTQPVDPEAREPPVVEPGGPVASGKSVLVAGQDRHPLVDVAVDDGELLR